MKFRNALIAIAILLAPLRADAWNVHGIFTLSSGHSELSLYTLSNDNSEYPFLNLFKFGGTLNYSNGSGALKPDEMDANGYPLSGANWTAQGGLTSLLVTPSQAERPGHYVFTWTGLGAPSLSGGTTTNVSCTGATSAGPTCDNSGCSTFTGSIAGTTLTVTAAPTGTGCTLAAGVPFTGAGVTISKFGTPTFITSAGSACGGNTCYTVNISQTVASTTLTMGGRFEVSVVDTTTNFTTWTIGLGTSSGNTSNWAFVFGGTGQSDPNSDESYQWASANPCPGVSTSQGCIVGRLFETRIQQGNFSVLRDLDWGVANTGNCSTWATRKPITYSRYATREYRNAASGPGQYVNVGGTGASGGTVSYNGGTDVYSVTLGAGGPVDKQTFLMLPPSTGTQSSKISLNGTTAVALLSTAGGSPVGSAGVPTAGKVLTFVYDAVLNGWLTYGGTSAVGFDCGAPPEVFIEINAELKTTPWHVITFLATDPMTDWVTQLATYEKANYPLAKPFFEPTNEPFNCNTNAPIYFSNKSAVYVSEDSAWHNGAVGTFCGGGGNNAAETGKIASTVGQNLLAVYGAGNFELAVPTQTGTAGTSSWASILQSTEYINQTIAPTQGGYTQTAAYLYATRLSVNNYWNTGYYGGHGNSQVAVGPEVIDGYCYYNYSISTPCQGLYASQQAVMNEKMNSSSTSSLAPFNVPSLTAFLAGWNSFAAVCGSATTRPGGCTINLIAPLAFYEGGFNESTPVSDVTQTLQSGTNAANAVLTTITNGVTANVGCVAGQTIALSGMTGGTWSTANGSYTVQATGTDATHCAINLNSTGLGTLTGGTLTYTGSGLQVTYLRKQAYLQPALTTLTTTVYNAVISNGGINPSQYQLAAPTDDSWYVFAFDLYGYYPLASCTSCSISGSTLTLGGTITGIFGSGQTLFGNSVTGVGTGAGSNTTITSTCTPIGSNVCGTTAGDTLSLSQASTSTNHSMAGYATPTTVGSNTTSPIQSWKAICTWNGNGAAC